MKGKAELGVQIYTQSSNGILPQYVQVELARPQMWQKRNALDETGDQLRSHDSSSENVDAHSKNGAGPRCALLP